MAYTITISEDDIRLVMVRFFRPTTNNEIEIQADYLPIGTDSRDDPVVEKPIENVQQGNYTETKLPQEYPVEIRNAIVTLNNYLEQQIIAQEYGSS